MRVGVVIPARGPAPFLREALAAVVAEGPAQVVVVDDGSEMPLSAAVDAMVEVLRRDVSGGPAAARNAGVARLAPGIDVVAFCDADDVWEPGSLALRTSALEAEPACAMAFGRARVMGPEGEDTGERWPLPGADLDDPADIYAANPILTSSVVLRRDAFPGFDESYARAEDWELWLRLLRAGHRLRPVPTAGVRYRRHAHGLTADVLALARAQQHLHEAHGDVVSAAERERVLAVDRAAVAEGLLRARRFAEARLLMPPGPRRAFVAVPGLRNLLGRSDPYRRRRCG